MMLTCQTLIQEIFQNLGLKEKGSSMENGGYIFTRRSIQCYNMFACSEKYSSNSKYTENDIHLKFLYHF